MSSINPEHKLTPAEINDLTQLEAVAQRDLGSYLQVGNALAEIRDRHLYRDSHQSFETYLRDRWGVNSAAGDPCCSKPCRALAKACEQTLSALDGDDRLGIEVRLVVGPQGGPGGLADGRSSDLSQLASPAGDGLLPTLRWLLAQASGTIGEVGYQLENHAAEIDDRAREHLRDDVFVLDEELALVKMLIAEVIDWDAEFARLLKDELPPLDTDPDYDGDVDDDDDERAR